MCPNRLWQMVIEASFLQSYSDRSCLTPRATCSLSDFSYSWELWPKTQLTFHAVAIETYYLFLFPARTEERDCSPSAMATSGTEEEGCSHIPVNLPCSNNIRVTLSIGVLFLVNYYNTQIPLSRAVSKIATNLDLPFKKDLCSFICVYS